MTVQSSDIPSGWTFAPLGRLVRFGNGQDYKDFEVSEGGYPVYGSGGEFRRANRYLYDGESVLFGRKGTVDQPLYVSGKFWTVDTMYFTVPEPGVHPKFLYYLATTIPFDRYATNTALPSMTSGVLRAHRVPLPPLEEQRAIADYLDEEAAQIDALVAKQEEFAGLLGERRRSAVGALLSRAPGGSATDKLHRRVRMGNGSTPRSSEDRYWVGGSVPWMNSSVVNTPEAREPSRFVTKAAIEECHLPLVRKGSVLVALTGQGKTRGMATILRIDSTINQHLAYITPDERFWIAEYLQWLLYSKYDELRRISGSSQMTV